MLIDYRGNGGWIDVAQIVVHQNVVEAGDVTPRICSWLDGFREDAVAQVTVQFMFWNQIDRASQQFGQLSSQGQALRKQIVAGIEFHEKIHVAFGTFFTSGH